MSVLPSQKGQCGCRCFKSDDHGSVSHVKEPKRDLVKDVHRLARLGVRLQDSLMVHHNSELSLVVEVKSKQDLDQPLMELKESVIGNLNESVS